MFHRSIETRLVVYPLSCLAAMLLYQGTNPGLYYLIGMGVYFWAFSEGEVSLHYTQRIVGRSETNFGSRLSVRNRGTCQGGGVEDRD